MQKKIVNHFKKVDPILYEILEKIEKVEDVSPKQTADHFTSLCREIIGQQLATKAASAIYDRFVHLLKEKKVTPKNVLAISDQKIRGAGLSWAKVRFIKDLAQKVDTGRVQLDFLQTLEDALVIEELTKVKGIGKWTAEMFLMFSLGRENIFSHGDLGLKKALQKIYKLKERPTDKQAEKIIKKWSPYKTYGCLILWRSLEI